MVARCSRLEPLKQGKDGIYSALIGQDMQTLDLSKVT